MKKIINTYAGANGCDIHVYDDYAVHECLWRGILLTFDIPKWFICWCRIAPLKFTIRSNKPIICLGDNNDINTAISVFKFSGLDNSPFKKVNKDNHYDLRPYMKQLKVIDANVRFKFKEQLEKWERRND